MRPLVLISIVLLACGEAASAPAPAPTPTADRPLPAPGAPAPSSAPVTPPLVAIGWDHLPRDPDAAARAANAEALRIHGHAMGATEEEARRVYEGSLAAFERVAEAHPDYLFARFNVACALARLGRNEEAIAIMRELLARDLPTFGPRLDADPDLASLSAATGFAALVSYRDVLRARYAAALIEGVPLIHATPTEAIAAPSDDADARERRTYQAGVWLHGERRFVPMAPRMVREVEALVSNLELTALTIDSEARAVLSFEGLGTWSEGGGPIAEGTVSVYEAGTGTERGAFVSGRGRAPAFCPPILAHATVDGLAMRFVEETDDGEFPVRTLESGEAPFDEARRPQISVTLAHASVLLPHGAPPEGVTLDRDMLEVGEARMPMPMEHHFPPRRDVQTRTTSWARRDASSFWVLTAGLRSIEWDSVGAGPAALSWVTVTDGVPTVRLLMSTREGVAALIEGPEGTAYVQMDGAVSRLSAGEPERLPEGLMILVGRPGSY